MLGIELGYIRCASSSLLIGVTFTLICRSIYSSLYLFLLLFQFLYSFLYLYFRKWCHSVTWPLISLQRNDWALISGICTGLWCWKEFQQLCVPGCVVLFLNCHCLLSQGCPNRELQFFHFQQWFLSQKLQPGGKSPHVLLFQSYVGNLSKSLSF